MECFVKMYGKGMRLRSIKSVPTDDETAIQGVLNNCRKDVYFYSIQKNETDLEIIDDTKLIE